MERIDLKATTKSTLLTVAMALVLEGEGGQMTRCHHREGERRPKLGVD